LTFAFAQTKGDTDKQFPKGERKLMPPPIGLHPQMLEELNLSDQQKQQIRVFVDKARSDSEQYFEEMKASDAQLRILVESGNFSEEKARQILNNKSQIVTEMEIIRLRADAAILNLLTAEQKTRLAQLRERRPPTPPGGGFRPNER
jgi:Spy/CpxP family protein refolding chaperone